MARSLEFLYSSLTPGPFSTGKIKPGEEYLVDVLERDRAYAGSAQKYRLADIYSATSSEDKYPTFIISVLDFMSQIGMYFEGQYSLTGTDEISEEFNEIYHIWFREFFFGDVFTCYSQEVLELEKNDWKANHPEINRFKAYGENKFRLFRFINEKTAKVWKFQSCYTNLIYEINTESVKFARASFNDGENWRWWWHIGYQEVAAEQTFLSTFKASTKRVLLKLRDKRKAEVEIAQLKDPTTTVLQVDETENDFNTYANFDASPPDVPKVLLESWMTYSKWRHSRLGYVEGINDKKERLTAGENFDDRHSASNFDCICLRRMNAFAKTMNELYGGEKGEGGNPPEEGENYLLSQKTEQKTNGKDIEGIMQLNFNLSNWGEAQGLPVSGDMVAEGNKKEGPDSQKDEPASQ